MKSMGPAPNQSDQQIDQSVGIGGLLEKNHENQTYRQGIGDIGQEIHRLIQVPQGLNGG